MNTIITLKDADIFPKEFLLPDPREYKTCKDRVKGIIEDNEGKVCLVWGDNKLLPGGGVERGETHEQALIREIKEEVGCNIEIKKLLGVSEEYWNNTARHQNVYCFVAKVIGEKGKSSSQQEDEVEIEAHWYTPRQAIIVLEEQIQNKGFGNYHFCFNARAHLAFLKFYQENVTR